MRHRLALVATLALIALPNASAAESDITLHGVDCGALVMDSEPFLPGVADRPEQFDMTDRCFLVVHPQGTLLWDAGLPVTTTWKVLTWVWWVVSLGGASGAAGPPLVDQLADLGMNPGDVDYVAFSHVHFDHVGQAGDFAQSTWLVQKVERDWIFDPELDDPTVFPSLVEPLRGSETVLLEGDHDVFGDGRVVILSAPGHTPGHQCLFVDLPETGPVVLSGDLYHSELNRERRVAPDFNTDRAQTVESMQRIEDFIAERNAALWIQHVKGSGPMAPAAVR